MGRHREFWIKIHDDAALEAEADACQMGVESFLAKLIPLAVRDHQATRLAGQTAYGQLAAEIQARLPLSTREIEDLLEAWHGGWRPPERP